MLCISALNFNSSEEIKRLKSRGAANLMAETSMYRVSAASIPAENAALTLKRIGLVFFELVGLMTSAWPMPIALSSWGCGMRLFLWGRRYEP